MVAIDKQERQYVYCNSKVNPERTTQEKYIGVLIDERLTFQDHIQEQVNKANKSMGMIRQAFEHINILRFRALFESIIRPTLNMSRHSRHHTKNIEVMCYEELRR